MNVAYDSAECDIIIIQAKTPHSYLNKSSCLRERETSDENNVLK